MGEDTLQHTMRICIEGPDILSNEQLDAVLDYYKGQKNVESLCKNNYYCQQNFSQ